MSTHVFHISRKKNQSFLLHVSFNGTKQAIRFVHTDRKSRLEHTVKIPKTNNGPRFSEAVLLKHFGCISNHLKLTSKRGSKYYRDDKNDFFQILTHLHQGKYQPRTEKHTAAAYMQIVADTQFYLRTDPVSQLHYLTKFSCCQGCSRLIKLNRKLSMFVQIASSSNP